VIYDTIGTSYNTTRRADPRIGHLIWSALEGCRSVLNVGAGTGAYEPADRPVVAVEPSAAMRRSRPAGSAPCVAGTAESLPFDDRSFDAAMAILTVHHWSDYRAGLRELRRVARHRVVVVHWDQAVMDRFWLAEYFPEAFAFDGRRGPPLREVRAALGPGVGVVPLPVPHDCQDGFGGAYWRRPGAYLDPAVRAGISMLAQTEHERGDGLERLRRDLSDGTWTARHHALLDQAELDCGYRLVVGVNADRAFSPAGQPGEPTRPG
jgi:SAM-dependent methyltransferase